MVKPWNISETQLLCLTEREGQGGGKRERKEEKEDDKKEEVGRREKYKEFKFQESEHWK